MASRTRSGAASSASRTRVATVVRDLAAERQCSIEKVGELLGVSRRTVFNMVGAKVEPTVDVLTRLARITGVSADWLLGFDTGPKLRQDRERAGSLALDFGSQLRANAPRGAALREIPTAEEHLARELARTTEQWWKERLLRNARYWSGRLIALADAILAAGPKLASEKGPVIMVSQIQAMEVRQAAAILRTPALDWHMYFETLVPGALLAFLDETDSRPSSLERDDDFLQTQFPVAGGGQTPHRSLGFAYRGARNDVAIYLEPHSGRVVTRTAGRFLSVYGWPVLEGRSVAASIKAHDAAREHLRSYDREARPYNARDNARPAKAKGGTGEPPLKVLAKRTPSG